MEMENNSALIIPIQSVTFQLTQEGLVGFIKELICAHSYYSMRTLTQELTLYTPHTDKKIVQHEIHKWLQERQKAGAF